MSRLATLAAVGAGAYLAYRALMPRYDFRGKNVLITGGSRGLGLLMARELAARGARLAICAREPDELGRAFDELGRTGARVVAVECDVTDRNRVREFVAVARQRLGPVDVLINNAGVIGVGPLEEMREEDFERSLRVHVWAPLWACLEVIPEMKARRAGRIVNVSSFGGKVAVPHMLPYVTGKFALVGLSNGLRAELARHGITVTTVCPGLMRTGSHLHAEFKGQHEKEYRWFAVGNAVLGFSMSGESAARKVLAACAAGDAEVVLGLPAKLAVAAWNVCPNLTARVLDLANRYLMPEPGGVGPERVAGKDSRGKTPSLLTATSDRAAVRNNELGEGVHPTPSPAGWPM